MIAQPRFWKKTEVSTEHSYNGTPCIDWTAATMPNGYGMFRSGSKLWLTHRMAWVFEYGDIPDGMFVCHHCDRPCCVNPEHLFLGTHQDNMDDKMSKGRHRRGDDTYNNKLSGFDVTLIKEFLRRHPPTRSNKHGGQCKFLGRWFGVGVACISDIHHGNSWRHITLEGASS